MRVIIIERVLQNYFTPLFFSRTIAEKITRWYLSETRLVVNTRIQCESRKMAGLDINPNLSLADCSSPREDINYEVYT